MNKNILKNYAPGARQAFIQAVKDKAALYGITEKSIQPCEVRGDFAIINGKQFPKIVDAQRKSLINQIKGHSFSYVIEEMAYTWFNRFAAIRFMEVNGFLSHGYRVLSHPEGHNIPEIVDKAQFIQGLEGLDKEEIIALKMAGDKDEKLYQRLLIAQCHELSRAMPFLFEKVDDPTELLLPDNLLHTASIIRDMVENIPEDDWQEVEIIGWLYQFYISQKKDALIKAKKAYKSEDIPAVTQLFTPNWIVKYLVQNSLGAKWMRTYPSSALKSKMEYYIQPAEQTPEVLEELKKITPSSLNPEEITVMDPACGSGHILVEAYDLLKEIYLERGYRRRDIPQLILEKNLFGLEIDHRAAQLAGFALMMKARRDDREIFGRDVRPNVVVIRGTKIQRHRGEEDNNTLPLSSSVPLPLPSASAPLSLLFENAETFGSLIRVPQELRERLPEIEKGIHELESKGDLLSYNMVEDLRHLVQQAKLLSQKYDVVVANPPYMGGKGMNMTLKDFANKEYPDTKSDLFAMFIERGFEMARSDIGYNAMVTMQSWMFLSSYENMRENILTNKTIFNMAHLGPRAFSTISGEVVTVTAFSFINKHIAKYRPTFLRLIDGEEEEKQKWIIEEKNAFTQTRQDDFKKIPGSPIAYWASPRVGECFANMPSFSSYIETREGLTTGCNDLFLRLWYEVSKHGICVDAKSNEDASNKGLRWVAYIKGGDFRKWSGNHDFVVNWENDGLDIKNFSDSNTGRIRSHNYNGNYGFREGFSWSGISSSYFAVRYVPPGFMFDAKGPMGFANRTNELKLFIAILNSKVANHLIKMLAPTLDFKLGHILNLPFKEDLPRNASGNSGQSISLSRMDWDSSENSWNFSGLPLLTKNGTEAQRGEDNNFLCLSAFDPLSLSISYDNYRVQCQQMTERMKELEEENNRIFIHAYGLEDELTPDVPDEEITLFANPKYRYRGDLTGDELEARFRADTMRELISYAVGCIMGRYSLDEPGLIYAHSGNDGFDPSRYQTFPADGDGIIPITDGEWFDDDGAFRFFRFIETVWAKDGLEDNLDFVADALGRKSGESSRDAIRRYFVNDFYKDHLQRYKKRPIYWLFSSGKEKAFQALVYLHRYNEGTLSRMRTEYVIPLQSRLSRHIENLERDRDAASSTSGANKIQKEIDKLRKQREELLGFDEMLRHYADMRIKLDLDDGVKVNYGKFGDLLAEGKGVTG